MTLDQFHAEIVKPSILRAIERGSVDRAITDPDVLESVSSDPDVMEAIARRLEVISNVMDGRL